MLISDVELVDCLAPVPARYHDPTSTRVAGLDQRGVEALVDTWLAAARQIFVDASVELDVEGGCHGGGDDPHSRKLAAMGSADIATLQRRWAAEAC
jgi:hypothetical protein